MNQIAPLLNLTRIRLDVDVSSRQHLYDWLGQQLAPDMGGNARLVTDSLSAREKLGSTALGQGVAVPHGRIKGLKSAIGTLVRTRAELPFDAPDHMPVNLLFILLVPAQATDLHLQILGELAQLFGDRDMREQLRRSADQQTVLTLIRNWQSGDEA